MGVAEVLSGGVEVLRLRCELVILAERRRDPRLTQAIQAASLQMQANDCR